MAQQRCSAAHLLEARMRLVHSEAAEQIECGAQEAASGVVLSRDQPSVPL